MCGKPPVYFLSALQNPFSAILRDKEFNLYIAARVIPEKTSDSVTSLLKTPSNGLSVHDEASTIRPVDPCSSGLLCYQPVSVSLPSGHSLILSVSQSSQVYCRFISFVHVEPTPTWLAVASLSPPALTLASLMMNWGCRSQPTLSGP